MYSLETGEIRKFSKVQGLSDVKLTTSAYSKQYKTIAIGYESGAIDLIEYPSYAMRKITTIFLKDIYGLKTIRDIQFQDSLMYVATDFGLVVYNLESHTFVSTTILGESGKYVAVSQVLFTESSDSVAVITEGDLYTIRKNDNISDFSLWSKVHIPLNENAKIHSGVYFNNSLFIFNPPYLNLKFYDIGRCLAAT